MAFDGNVKLLPEQEEALLESLKAKRDYEARVRLQSESQAVARKLGDIAIEKVPDAAEKAANKDRRNFGLNPNIAVATITLNAIFLDAARKKEEESVKGKGKKDGGYGKKTASKVTAKVERLPPPSCDAVVAALKKHKATLQKASNFDGGELAVLRSFEAWVTLEVNEDLLESAPEILETFLQDDLVQKDTFLQYWASVQSTREEEGKALRALQEEHKQAKKEHVESLQKLKEAEEAEKDAAMRFKRAAAEASKAWRNAQTDEEAAWEKAVTDTKNKTQAEHEQRGRTLEACRKRQAQLLNTREAADRAMREKADQILPLELMDMNALDWFQNLMGNSAVNDAAADGS
eukprot:TRINITY_DN42572_c0_g1_i1.p1 TRINITY_DN42572_c0_g1~~TRINITY_DN42572_c0_g1_i1.p1  ORF type:complete len:348 (+),score=103.66 TRINITY_DN42572_c0_g1_i1:73-1116(+)